MWSVYGCSRNNGQVDCTLWFSDVFMRNNDTGCKNGVCRPKLSILTLEIVFFFLTLSALSE